MLVGDADDQGLLALKDGAARFIAHYAFLSVLASFGGFAGRPPGLCRRLVLLCGTVHFLDERQALGAFAGRFARGLHGAADGFQGFCAPGRIGRQHLRNGGERRLLVEQQAEELLAQVCLNSTSDMPLFSARIFRSSLKARSSTPSPARPMYTRLRIVASRTPPSAMRAFSSAIRLLDEGDALRVCFGPLARGSSEAGHSDQGLQQRGAVGRQEDLLHGLVAHVAVAVEGADDRLRYIRLPLQQRIVGRYRLALLANLLGELGDLLHQRVAVGEEFEAAVPTD
jgi:hypothetical protein